MRDTAAAETVVKMAVKNTHATVRKQNKPARNRRPVFKAWTVSKLLEAYKDPRAILLEIASTDTAALAKQMNGSLADALAERRLCAQAVLPYLAQKLPISVEMKTTRAIHLNLVDERKYEELVAVAASEEQPDEDSFSIALLPNTSDAQTPAQSAEQTAEQRAVIERTDRGTPVTPSAPAASPQGPAAVPSARLKSKSEWWDSLDGRRRQRIDDVPSGPGRGSWERVDRGGCFAPADRDKPK